MYKKVMLLIVLMLVSSIIIFADTGIYETKEEIIKEIITFSKVTYENAPRQEGKIATGLTGGGETVYTDYPQITNEIRDNLIEDTLVKIENFLNDFSKEELVLGFDEYQIKIVEQARFNWLPNYQEPEYAELSYYEEGLREPFKFAIRNNEEKIKEEMEKKL